ncbi:hypothetical protein PR048_007719 [Dryococelus australis]|uniref:Uncharacterized protein n=1 Tax=Dryococelus australis TaxID=614101 RepID=A0ABQ9HVF5_9NEOP|nr:hypothetical protein PR048_007719 [Dryococelus australis]
MARGKRKLLHSCLLSGEEIIFKYAESRSEGAIRATLTRTPSVLSLLRARRLEIPSSSPGQSGGRGRTAGGVLASHQKMNRVRFPAGAAPGFSHVRIVANDAASLRDFSSILALLHTHLAYLSYSLRTLILSSAVNEMFKMPSISTNTCINPPLHGHPDALMNPCKIPDCFATLHNTHYLSDDKKVALRSLTLQSSGLYRCEVSAEAPSFASAQKEAHMEVVREYMLAVRCSQRLKVRVHRKTGYASVPIQHCTINTIFPLQLQVEMCELARAGVPRQHCTINTNSYGYFFTDERLARGFRGSVPWVNGSPALIAQVTDLYSEDRGFAPRRPRRGGCSARLPHWEFVNASGRWVWPARSPFHGSPTTRNRVNESLGLGKLREFSDLQARLLSTLHTGASTVCSLAVTPRMAVMEFERRFLASLLFAQRRGKRRGSVATTLEAMTLMAARIFFSIFVILSKGRLHHHGSKLDPRWDIGSTLKTIAPFEFRAGLEIEIKFISNRRNLRFEPRSAAIDYSISDRGRCWCNRPLFASFSVSPRIDCRCAGPSLADSQLRHNAPARASCMLWGAARPYLSIGNGIHDSEVIRETGTREKPTMVRSEEPSQHSSGLMSGTTRVDGHWRTEPREFSAAVKQLIRYNPNENGHDHFAQRPTTDGSSANANGVPAEQSQTAIVRVHRPFPARAKSRLSDARSHVFG